MYITFKAYFKSRKMIPSNGRARSGPKNLIFEGPNKIEAIWKKKKKKRKK